jgi:hypothetical protein
LAQRLVEWRGQAVDTVVATRCLPREPRRANLLEDPGEALPVSGHQTRVRLRPYEIGTPLVECTPE